MEGKLIKVENDYRLVNKIIIGTTDLEYQQAFSDVCQKLSIKNCEAVANGYDLDELAGEYANKELNVELTSKAGNFYGFSSSFKEGFQKAVEILGDKKFSEDDLREAISQTRKGMLYNKQYEDEHIQSLQQTEWDVEIEMEKEVGTKLHDDGREFFMIDGTKPKLDKDGCLILKRK